MSEFITLRNLPPWYVALFTTDLLERFGFYGLQAILVLYAASPTGLALPSADAASLFGAWIATTFMLSLLGGWLGDRVLGQRRALITGAAIGTAGYLCLTLPGGTAATAGLCALAAGLALYMPNYQAQGTMMLHDPRARESAVSFIYVASQLSALLAPLVAGYLGERVSWSLAFLVCATGTALAGLNILARGRLFGEKGLRPGRPLDPAERVLVRRRALLAVGGLLAVLVGLALAGVLTPGTGIVLAGGLSALAPLLGYRWLRRDPALTAAHRVRLRAFLAVFLGATLFWMIIAHAASLLNLFARDHVDRRVLGGVFPASWLQAVTPLFILLLAPTVGGAVLRRFGGRHNVAAKFALGLHLVGTGFLVMAAAARLAEDGLVSPLWLVFVYLTAACGELVIASVSIAATASVLPQQFIGRMLGMYWLFAALGGALGAGVVRLASVLPEWLYYLALGTVTSVAGLAFAFGRHRLTAALERQDPVSTSERK